MMGRSREDRRQMTDDRREETVIQWVSNSVNQLISKSVSQLVSELRGLKASKPGLQANSYELYIIRHPDAFAADSVQSKKPSGGPKGLIGPPCHGEVKCG
jgi:hypothetical protein